MPEFVFSPMPHTEAVQRIESLPIVSRAVMDGLLPELRAHAFVVSGVEAFDRVSQIRDQIRAVPAGEQTWTKAKKAIAAELREDLGGKAAERRAELLLRTHAFRGYAAARYRTLMAQRDVFPFWQYKTHGDGRVRPSHAALNNRIFPAGHPIWQRIFPPWDWGCRCLVVPLLGKDVDRRREDDGKRAAEDRLIYDGPDADLINQQQRLPGGISLLPSQSWGGSPWSEKGELRHTWELIRARYAHDPDLLAAFEAWARSAQIGDSKVTVGMWLDGQAATRDKVGQAILTPGEMMFQPPGSVAGVDAASILAAHPKHPASVAMKLWGDDEETFSELITGNTEEAEQWRGVVKETLDVVRPMPQGTVLYRGWKFPNENTRDKVMADLAGEGIFTQIRAGMSASMDLSEVTKQKFFNEHGVVWELHSNSAIEVEQLFRALKTKYPGEREAIIPSGKVFDVSGPALRTLNVDGQLREVMYYVLQEK